MLRQLLFIALVTGSALCQNDNKIDLDAVKSNIPGLDNFNEADLPQREEVEKVLREKCEKNGGAGVYDEIANSHESIQTCLQQYLNQTVIMDELEVAKKTGSMDDVFGKYCKQRTDIIACVTGVTKKVEKCLEPKEQETLKLVLNITDSLIDFVCYKDGDRLAMFVAEGGFECLQDHKEALQECANKTLSSRIPKDISITNLPLLTFTGDSQCADMLDLQKCAVEELEKCKNNTPANIVEALFKFIKKVSPCKDYTPGAPSAQRILHEADDNSIVPTKVKRSQQVDFASVDNFRDKCTKYAGPKAFEDLSLSLNETKMCIQTLLKQKNVCGYLITEGKSCIRRTVNKLRVCLPPQESYLPAFLMASVDNGLKYLCDDQGHNFNKFLNGLPCMISSSYGNQLSDCMASTKTKRTKDNPIVTKSELCEDMDRIKICLNTYITNHCLHMPELKETTMGLVEAVKSPCAGCGLVSNSILIATAVAMYFARRLTF